MEHTQDATTANVGSLPDEVELLRTHSAKSLRRIYLADQIFDLIAWAAVLGTIAIGCYWLVQL